MLKLGSVIQARSTLYFDGKIVLAQGEQSYIVEINEESKRPIIVIGGNAFEVYEKDIELVKKETFPDNVIYVDFVNKCRKVV
jgi:hypothetical protein